MSSFAESSRLPRCIPPPVGGRFVWIRLVLGTWTVSPELRQSPGLLGQSWGGLCHRPAVFSRPSVSLAGLGKRELWPGQ